MNEHLNDNGIDIASRDNLKALIKNIAQCHACEIHNGDKNEVNCELSVEHIGAQVISSDLFDALDKVAAAEEIKLLNASVQTVISEDILVKNNSIGKPVPLSYEVLSLIFAQTNEKFRQKYFHELIDFYCNEFCRILEKIDCSYAFKRPEFDTQVKILLPVVKFETLLKIVENGESANHLQVTELVKNITNYFNYSRINQEDIYAVINNKIGSSYFNLISYELILLDEKNGHLGEYFQLKIDIKNENKEEHVNLFAKFLTPKMEMMKQFVKQGPSKKEEFFYLKYLSKLREVGLTELLDFAPNCYFSRLHDVLILDNMTTSGFVGLTPNTRLEFDALKVAVKEIAKFHSCSFILEEILSKNEGKHVTLGDLYSEYVQEVLFNPEIGQFKGAIEHAVQIMMFITSHFPEITKKYTDVQLLEKAQNGWKLVFEKVKRSDKYKNSICHGDMYVANMLFNFNEHKVCKAAVLVDFQVLRYCPPTQDLLFFLYQNAFKETLDAHKTELLDEYYNTLSTCLEKFNLNPAELYSRKDFDESAKYMNSEGIFHAFFYCPLQLIDPKFREELFRDPKHFETFKQDPFGLYKMAMKEDNYRRMMKGLTAYFVELCDNGEI